MNVRVAWALAGATDSMAATADPTIKAENVFRRMSCSLGVKDRTILRTSERRESGELFNCAASARRQSRATGRPTTREVASR
jgi:hypothetical protein